MSHCYASTDTFKAFLVSNGVTDFGTTDDAAMLTILEASSRRVDSYCRRSMFGSGFGPRIGTNKYDTAGGTNLDLLDDLLSVSAATLATATGGTGATITLDTDYYLQPYTAPYRALQMILTSLPTGYRVMSITGTWGASNETAASTTTVASGLSVGTTATTFTTSASPTISAGDTLLVGTEQLYVTGMATTTATVARGANGTTAATHADASAIAVYRYPRDVVRTTLLLAQRAWRAREAGVTGDFGGGGVPGSGFRDSESSILRALDSSYRAWLVG